MSMATLWTSLQRLKEVTWSEGLILSVLPAFYGAPHLIGWYAVFPTMWERIAWRVSSLVVMGSGLAAFVLFGAVAWVYPKRSIMKAFKGRRDNADKDMLPVPSNERADDAIPLLPVESGQHHPSWNEGHGKKMPFLNGLANQVIAALILVLYVAATGFLLIESFRQLFSLPPGAFELPSWTASIPHFG